MTNPQIQQYTDKVDDFMKKYPTMTAYDHFKELEVKTGYPKAWFFIGAVVLAFTIVTLVGGAKLLVDLVGFVYPAYQTFKSIENANKSVADDTQWLTYWVTFAFFSIVEGIFKFVTAWIPMYFWLKIAVIVWMWYPTTRGAQTIYDQLLRPNIVVPYMESTSGKTKKGE